jgi:hypothetical protein
MKHVSFLPTDGYEIHTHTHTHTHTHSHTHTTCISNCLVRGVGLVKYLMRNLIDFGKTSLAVSLGDRCIA